MRPVGATSRLNYGRVAKPASVQRKHRPDYQLVLYMGLLMILGLIVMYAIGPQQAMVKNHASGGSFESMHFFTRQLFSLGMALGAFFAMAITPIGLVKKWAFPLLLFGFGVSSVLAIAGLLELPIAQCSLGACRWFVVPGIGTFQPAELLKLGILVYGAGFLGIRMKKGLIDDWEKSIIPFLVIMAIAALFVVVFQNDLGTGLALAAIAGSMLFVAGLNLRIMGLIGLAGLALVVVFIVMAPHRMERVATFFASEDSARAHDEGYHIRNAKIAIGSGGFFGLGIGNSVQATGYLPEAINDSVFAIMGETFGFVGLVVVLALFFGLLWRLLHMSDRLQEPWMRLVAAGVFGWLGAHVFLNIAAMLDIAPLTGITLPLLSFGGTSMLFISAALGLAFQISRYTSHSVVDVKEAQSENSGSRRGIGRTRYASRRSITRA